MYFFRCFLLFIVCCAGLPVALFAREQAALKQAFEEAKHDTIRCRLLYELIEAEADDNVWPSYNKLLEEISTRNLSRLSSQEPGYKLYQKYLGAALNNKAVLIQNKGNSTAALQYYFKSLSLRIAIADSAGIGETLNNIGLIYHALGNIPMAIDYYQRSLAVQEKINDIPGTSTTLLNLGVLSADQRDFKKAREYFVKSYTLLLQTDDDYGKAYSLNNLANSYQREGDYKKAYLTYKKSLEIREKIKDTKGIAYSLLNLGVLITIMDSSSGHKQIPLELFKSLEIFKSLEEKEGIATVMYRLSQQYFLNGNNEAALRYAGQSLQLSRELGYPEHIRDAASVLYHVYKAQHRDQQALSMYELYTAMRDSISNEDIRRISIGKQFQYEFDKRTTADSVKAAEQQKVMTAQVSKERTQRFAITGVLMLTIVFSAFVLNRWRIIKNQKQVIQQKNADLSAEKQKSDNLLLNILPADTADELKRTGRAGARKFKEVSVLFTDFVNFTKATEQMDADTLVAEIHYCYSAFDKIISAYSIEKIKTIGDGYLCASGLPIPNPTHAMDLVKAALDIRHFMNQYKEERKREGKIFFEVRIGIHSGPVVAGVVGTKKFAYDIWGDTVNIAARMEAAALPGTINISEKTCALIASLFTTEYRGMLEVKNKGAMKMYFVL